MLGESGLAVQFVRCREWVGVAFSMSDLWPMDRAAQATEFTSNLNPALQLIPQKYLICRGLPSSARGALIHRRKTAIRCRALQIPQIANSPPKSRSNNDCMAAAGMVQIPSDSVPFRSASSRLKMAINVANGDDLSALADGVLTERLSHHTFRGCSDYRSAKLFRDPDSQRRFAILHEDFNDRHGLGTALADNKVSPKLVQSILRHADIATTFKFYVHADADAQREDLQSLQRSLRYSKCGLSSLFCNDSLGRGGGDRNFRSNF